MENLRVRHPAGAAIAAVFATSFSGCGGSGTPLPNGATQSATTNIVGRGQPSQVRLEYFSTPSKGEWPMYIANGPQETLWFTEEFTDRIGRMTTDGKMTDSPISNGQEPRASPREPTVICGLPSPVQTPSVA